MNTCILIGTVAWLHLSNGSGTELYINVDNIAHVNWDGWIETNSRYSAAVQAWSEDEDSKDDSEHEARAERRARKIRNKHRKRHTSDSDESLDDVVKQRRSRDRSTSPKHISRKRDYSRSPKLDRSVASKPKFNPPPPPPPSISSIPISLARKNNSSNSEREHGNHSILKSSKPTSIKTMVKTAPKLWSKPVRQVTNKATIRTNIR